jgi:hypothetical protein
MQWSEPTEGSIHKWMDINPLPYIFDPYFRSIYAAKESKKTTLTDFFSSIGSNQLK